MARQPQDHRGGNNTESPPSRLKTNSLELIPTHPQQVNREQRDEEAMRVLRIIRPTLNHFRERGPISPDHECDRAQDQLEFRGLAAIHLHRAIHLLLASNPSRNYAIQPQSSHRHQVNAKLLTPHSPRLLLLLDSPRDSGPTNNWGRGCVATASNAEGFMEGARPLNGQIPPSGGVSKTLSLSGRESTIPLTQRPRLPVAARGYGRPWPAR